MIWSINWLIQEWNWSYSNLMGWYRRVSNTNCQRTSRNSMIRVLNRYRHSKMVDLRSRIRTSCKINQESIRKGDSNLVHTSRIRSILSPLAPKTIPSLQQNKLKTNQQRYKVTKWTVAERGKPNNQNISRRTSFMMQTANQKMMSSYKCKIQLAWKKRIINCSSDGTQNSNDSFKTI